MCVDQIEPSPQLEAPSKGPGLIRRQLATSWGPDWLNPCVLGKQRSPLCRERGGAGNTLDTWTRPSVRPSLAKAVRLRSSVAWIPTARHNRARSGVGRLSLSSPGAGGGAGEEAETGRCADPCLSSPQHTGSSLAAAVCPERCRCPTPCSARSRSTSPRSCPTF